MAGLKTLAKDTVIYGLSSIIGRFLNYLLVPLYTAVIPAASGGYGVVSNVYAYTALILVFLTFGMETGFFRFANKQDNQPKVVYANALLFVGDLAILFILLGSFFLHPIATLLEYPQHPDYVWMMMAVVALDSFQCIPFAYLRFSKRPLKFAAIKLLNIIGNILLNLFFLLVCPWLMQHAPHLIDWFFDPSYLVGYIFVSNLFMSALQMFFFIPELLGFRYRIDPALLKEMIVYSFPILIFGLVGILNQTVDKMIYPFLFENRHQGLVQLGIYSATSKVALVMAMFTQAFRYAYEPFVFGESNKQDNRMMYANAMKFFYLFALLAFLVVMLYMDILRHIIAPDYWEGLKVVPIVMGAEILKGVYFNLSFWYKLTDETRWGAYFSLIGCLIIVGMNIWLVPAYGYMASAWASVCGYAVITLLSYFIGQRKYPVVYPLRTLLFYTALTYVIYMTSEHLTFDNAFVRFIVHSLLLLLFLAVFIKRDFPLHKMPFIHKFIKHE